MCPAYYFLLLVNLVQSPNGLYVPMPESPQSSTKSKICLKVPKVRERERESPSQAWVLPFKGRSLFILTSMVISSIIMEVIHMYISLALKLL